MLRKNDEIGSALDADVTIYCQGERYASLAKLDDELRFVMMTSDVTLVETNTEPTDAVAIVDEAMLWIGAVAGKNEKCVRCWHHRDDVGSNDAHPELCSRCVDNVEGEGEVRHYA